MRLLLFSTMLFGAVLCQDRRRTQTMWGQCGGREYTGATVCPTGAYCMNDGNEWYSQCLPINDHDHDGDDNGWGDQVITKTIGTIFSVGGPTPTVVTTYITFLTPSSTPPPRSTATTITLTPDEPITSFWPRAPRAL